MSFLFWLAFLICNQLIFCFWKEQINEGYDGFGDLVKSACTAQLLSLVVLDDLWQPDPLLEPVSCAVMF